MCELGLTRFQADMQQAPSCLHAFNTLFEFEHYLSEIFAGLCHNLVISLRFSLGFFLPNLSL